MRTRRLTITIAGAGLAAALLAACTGLPDTTFGGGGLTVLPQQFTSPLIVSLANGKTMVASFTDSDSRDPRVVRLNANGSVDPNYGTSGRLDAVQATAAALGPDGRAYFIDFQRRLTAYTVAGKQDLSFGSVQ